MDSDSDGAHYQALRDLVYRATRDKETTQTIQPPQAQEVLNRAAFFAFQTGVVSSSNHVRGEGQAGAELPEQDKETMKAILWDMATSGVIVPGNYGALDGKWPSFTVSKYGHEYLSSGPESPYDPEGFIKALMETSPGIDDDVLFYVEQSLRCFLRGFLQASAVLLGVAAEKVVLDVVDAYGAHLASSNTKASAQFETAVKGKFVSKQLDRLLKSMSSEGLDLPPPVKDFNRYLGGIGNLIRKYRNQAGHPNRVRIERRAAYANLQLFEDFCGNSYKLARHLKPT